MKKNGKNRGRWAIVPALILAGAFFMGIGYQQVRENRRIIDEYENSSLRWKREIAGGMETAEAKDLQNQILLENREYISIEKEIYFETAQAQGEARISNGENSEFSCTVTMFGDTGGEVLFESGLIEPGYYIEWIKMNKELKQGHYPCTVVWSFYSAEGEFAGDLAEDAVVVVKN